MSNIFYPTTDNTFNSAKKQFPRTHLTLSPSRLRSLLYPPLCHKCVSVWTWTLNQNKQNLIKWDFTDLVGTIQSNWKRLNYFSAWFYNRDSGRIINTPNFNLKKFVKKFYVNRGRTLFQTVDLQFFRYQGHSFQVF